MDNRCRTCGQPTGGTGVGRPKVYCSPRCKGVWFAVRSVSLDVLLSIRDDIKAA